MKKLIHADRAINVKMVPNTPKNPINPRFWKNSDLRRLYPAEKIIGGRTKVKNISFENIMEWLKA